jgi:hypothetical protein
MIKKVIKKNNSKKGLDKKIILIIIIAVLILLIFLGIYLYKNIPISGRAVSIFGSSESENCISDSQCSAGLKCLACERINSAIVASYPVSEERPGNCVKSCV